MLDRATGTCRARVLSQRTAHAAATAGATTAAAAEAAALSAAAAGPVGAGAGAAAAASSRAWGSDAYGHVFVTAGEADAAEGWAPPQVGAHRANNGVAASGVHECAMRAVAVREDTELGTALNDLCSLHFRQHRGTPSHSCTACRCWSSSMCRTITASP